MIQPTQLTKNIYGIEVPEDAYDFRIDGNGLEPLLTALLAKHAKYDSWNKLFNTALPPGNWHILCTYPDCTEQEAAEVVEYLDLSTRLYRDYDAPAFTHWFLKPNDSLTSLLRSKGLGPDKNYLIIKKEQQ